MLILKIECTINQTIHHTGKPLKCATLFKRKNSGNIGRAEKVGHGDIGKTFQY